MPVSDMNQSTKSINYLSEDQRKVAIEQIIDYFSTERDEEIGVIAAEDILDVFLDILGPSIFNAGVNEARKAIQTGRQNMDFELELLLKDKD